MSLQLKQKRKEARLKRATKYSKVNEFSFHEMVWTDENKSSLYGPNFELERK